MDPQTVKDAISSFQAGIKAACIEEAAGAVGKIISDQFGFLPFQHPLKFDGTDTFISATQHDIEIDGYDIGFWLKEVSKGEGEYNWNDPYPFNYEALLKDGRVPLSKWPYSHNPLSKLKKDEIIKHKGQRTPLYNRPYSEAFIAEVNATPQPLMRDFQADSLILSWIVYIAISTALGETLTAPQHLFLLSVYWNCKTKNNDPSYKPGITKVWAAVEKLAKTEPEHDLLREVTKDNILWHGTDQPMGRKTVSNLLSIFHKFDANTIQEVLRKAT